MTITDVETILLTGPCTNDPYLSEARKRRSAAFVEIATDCGIIGLGETYAGYFFPEVIPPIVEFFKPVLLGQTIENVGDIQKLWNSMYHCGNFWCRVGLGIVVLNGIEAALWDLLGHLLKLPVCVLLGGVKHDELPCYATGGPSNYPLDRLARKVEYYQSLGFGALKIGVGAFSAEAGWQISASPAEAADVEAKKLEFLHQRFGSDLRIMMDAHMGNSPGGEAWSLETALAVAKALEPFGLSFLEEPLHYSKREDYAELCRNTSLPIAGGECLTGTNEWRDFVVSDCFDIGQPDASFTGGLREFMEVSAMLMQKQRQIATHAWGAAGSLMQNIHCGFACANTFILEIPPAFGSLHSEIIQEPLDFKDGKITAPLLPGLGIRITEDIKNRFPFVPGSGEFNSVPGKMLVN